MQDYPNEPRRGWRRNWHGNWGNRKRGKSFLSYSFLWKDKTNKHFTFQSIREGKEEEKEEGESRASFGSFEQKKTETVYHGQQQVQDSDCCGPLFWSPDGWKEPGKMRKAAGQVLQRQPESDQPGPVSRLRTSRQKFGGDLQTPRIQQLGCMLSQLTSSFSFFNLSLFLSGKLPWKWIYWHFQQW